MHHEEIELNFDASCQQILGLESEILWEACSTPTLAKLYKKNIVYSICNLAVTSVYLRQVCCSLLDQKGCVSLQWERIKLKDSRSKYRWDVAYKRWFFSTSLGSIEKWAFTDTEAVSEHLKTCPYNVRTKHKDLKKTNPNWPVVMTALDARLAEKRKTALSTKIIK
jgi:hypothetical protein